MIEATTLLQKARELDLQEDPACRRADFHFPETAPVYLCGNSLGLQPRRVGSAVGDVLADWRRFAVEGHFEAARPWMSYHEALAPSLAGLLGAREDEVVCMNSLSVNLHLLMASFYRPTPERPALLIEDGAFPSDRYAAASQVSFHGFDPQKDLLRLKPRPGEDCLRAEDILRRIDAEGARIALILLGGVNYYTGQSMPMREITEAGHRAGCQVAFDLAHAAGNIELALHDWGVDWAACCGYKYLNSGPGGLSAVYVHERHALREDLPRFAGWWGHDKDSRFRMPEDFRPIPGAEGWQLSNPPILPMAALRASLELFDEVGMPALRERSRRLTGFLEESLSLVDGGFRQLTPRDASQRGAQLSLHFPQGAIGVMQGLRQRGVICDLRRPDVIRVAPAPLYNNHEDCASFVLALDESLRESRESSS